MKKLLITLTATLACAGAFAQGSLTFAVNSDNLIYFTTDTAHLNPADVGKTFDVGSGGFGPFPLAGALAATGPGVNGGSGSIQVLAGSPAFIVGLFGGTSSSSLSLQTTTTIDSWGNGNPGGIVAVIANMHSPFTAGTPAWFQVQVYDSRAANANAAMNTGLYYGTSPIFQATPLVVPNCLYSPYPPINSTWAPGTFNPTDLVALGVKALALAALVFKSWDA